MEIDRIITSWGCRFSYDTGDHICYGRMTRTIDIGTAIENWMFCHWCKQWRLVAVLRKDES